MDSQLTLLIQENCPGNFGIGVVFEIDYNKQEDGLCVVIEVISERNEEIYSYLCQTIKYYLQKSHQLHLKNVLFLNTDTIGHYLNGDTISRFHLRDAILLKKVPQHVFFWENSELQDGSTFISSLDQDESKKCDTCYNTKLPAPLSLRNFDIVSEWQLDVPIEIQVILSVFINKDTLRRSPDAKSYLQGKLERLFTLYDGLLNTLNKNYIGIFQQANTDELLYDYRNIKSVFKITAASGATASHVKAEGDWKKRADDDILYYNTYLKPHQMTYLTDAGLQTKGVSLRHFHAILMLDNLVRLQSTSMPWRGESKSKQLATLPLTIQGLPTDATLTENWHDTTICDGTFSCQCKRKVALSKADIDTSLLVPTSPEKVTYLQFQRLCTWGYMDIWHKMPDDLTSVLEDNTEFQEGSTTLLSEEVDSVEKEADRLVEDDSTNEQEDFRELLQTIDVRQLEETDNLVDIDLAEVVVTAVEEEDPDSDDTVLLDPMDYLDKIAIQPDSNDEGFVISRPSTQIQTTVENYFEETTDTMKHIAVLKADSIPEEITELEQSILNMSVVEESVATNHMKMVNLDSNPDDLESGLEKSFLDLSLVEEQDTVCKNVVESFGFTKFSVPPLLTRHPPPAVGRDDDISKIREILDDVLLKLGHLTNAEGQTNRILCGPDHKVGNSVLKLMSMNDKYASFLPEFPLLHLRKSMITILFSAYNDAGLFHILRYMRDDDKQEWSNLVSVHHIDMATRNVRRLSIALHLAFLLTFAKTLPESECEVFLYEARHSQNVEVSTKWSERLERFMDKGTSNNATFALHRDMMKHCDKVVAVALAERLGGKQGYELLLATVKSSLAFSFINGASSYGPYCVQLLYHHYSAGYFHARMKESLFTTPIGKSNKNFACDTKREMDHLEAVKGFRSGSTLSSVTARMSLIDSLNEASKSRNDKAAAEFADEDSLGWSVTEADLSHIYPTTLLILRRCGLSLQENHVPFNVYSSIPTALPPSILDDNSCGIGEYLIKKYLVKEKLFQFQQSDLVKEQITGPVELVNRAKRAKGTTLKRMLKSKLVTVKTDSELKEEARQKMVEKKSKEFDCLTSKANACQALLKPDLSKPKVYKALGMSGAISDQVAGCIKVLKQKGSVTGSIQADQYMLLGTLEIPQSFTNDVTFATMEFAGIKFKTGHCTSGQQYLQYTESVIRKALKQFPRVSKLVICEKYSYTPDDFKCATRLQRQSSTKISIEHLKDAQSVLSDSKFNKDVLTKTSEGKALISNYLAENIDKLSFNKELCLVVDSEHVTENCTCTVPCACRPPAIPISKTFHESVPAEKAVKLSNIRQYKGEAEMSQVDWLIQEAEKLKPGEAAASIVTSGDIDSVYIHLFALSLHWPRDTQNKFCNPVYIILHKPDSKNDIYNVTLMLELFESAFADKMVGVKLAVALCIGGNDYIPKFQQISHKTVVQQLLAPKYRTMLYSSLSASNIVLDANCFVCYVKELYCPRKFGDTAESISYETVRAISIGKKVANSPTGYVTRDAKLWLPPESAIIRLAELIQFQIDYLMTVGFHAKQQPNFLGGNCLKKIDGKVTYDLGPDAHFASLDSLPVVKNASTARKRAQNITPQKGARRKQPRTSTPVKHF